MGLRLLEMMGPEILSLLGSMTLEDFRIYEKMFVAYLRIKATLKRSMHRSAVLRPMAAWWYASWPSIEARRRRKQGHKLSH